MKPTLLFLFLLSTVFLFSHSIDKIDRQILVQVAPQNSRIEFLQKLFPDAKIQLSAKTFDLWNVEFAHTPPMGRLLELKLNRSINFYMRNRRLQARATLPNDTFFSLQTFHLNNFNPGQSVSYGINSIGAWDYAKTGVTAKGDTIVVAVIESGFDSFHQDLDYFINKNEIPNDSLDNDGNGAVDDFRGWNVAENSSSLIGVDVDHAMKVCGSFAKGNNKIGISGVTWNCKILPVNLGTILSIENAIKAKEYCLKMKRLHRLTNGVKGAYIVAINFSYGTVGDPAEDTLWKAAIDSLGKEGIYFCASVINQDKDSESANDLPILFNSNFQINVTNYNFSTLGTDGSSFSNKYVHIAAPDKYFSTKKDNQYGNCGYGASFSAPVVAGTIALMYSNMCEKFLDSLHTQPEKYSKKIKDILIASVDTTSGLKNKVVSNGKLNVYKSILYIHRLNDSFCKKDTSGSDTTAHINAALESEKPQIYHHEKIIYIKKLKPIPLHLSLHNMLGQRVLEKTIENIEEKVNIHHIPQGIYILSYFINQRFITEKIVVD